MPGVAAGSPALHLDLAAGRFRILEALGHYQASCDPAVRLGVGSAASRSDSRRKRHEGGLWQRRFWEHVIRDEADLRMHVDYIHWNPVKHGHVKQVKEWPFSTFRRYVALGIYPLDWGGVDEQCSSATGFGESIG